ncbi:MAG TPA: SLBB domain-containing protein [Candidatus Angelobacter sp.]|nr:SLBB domain-containing protein [Candidatus Angelobacter sp.]
MSSLFISVRVRLIFLLALMMSSFGFAGRLYAQDTELSADEIIQVLQENPDVLADAKAEIVAQLRDRGYNVSEKDITDDRLFSQIRSNDQVRQMASDELVRRGFGPQGDEGTSAQDQQNGQQVSGQNQDQNQPQNQGQGQGQPQNQGGQYQGEYSGMPLPSPTPQGRIFGQLPSRSTQPGTIGSRTRTTQRPQEQGKQKPAGPPQEQYPLRNLPALRDLYTQALPDDTKLERFGAALFRNSIATSSKDNVPLSIPIGPDYVLGPGDEMVIDYWGSSTQHIQRAVDREGRIALPEAGTLVVAGRTLGEAQQMVQRMLGQQLRGISVDVTLGKLRSVRVFVVGDIKNPGAYDISSLSTPLSALIAAGGPTETGSYRIVKHYRGKALVEEVDLYDLMLKGVSGAEVHLESGDTILVPTVGPQVTVSGKVRRPAIYELRHEQTLDQVLDLAGGVPVTGELNQIKVERVQAHERKEMLSVSLNSGSTGHSSTDGVSTDAFSRFRVQDGDVVIVAPILPYSNRTVYLQGHVFRPGKYPYKEGFKVTDLIGSFDDLLPEPADRAEIIRLHLPDFAPEVIPFNLHDVLAKTVAAPSLEPFDTVRVFGRYEIDAPKVSIYGEVLRPGEYPLTERMTAADLLRLAGGFKRSAYRQAADLTSYSIVDGDRVELEHRDVRIERALAGEADTDVLLKPGDVLTISQIGGWSDIGGAISVTGEVGHPGRYGIERGEHLSSILKRVGGFSAEAYPYAAILDRASVREASAKSREDMVARLQDQTMVGSRTQSIASQREQQQLINRLKQIQPSGRMIIHINAPIEKWTNTIADIEVRPGDTLYIPKKPNFVMVAGQVYNPAAITFSPGKNAKWYLKQAGGPTSLADKKYIFVVRANGTVVGHGSGEWWSGNVLSTVLQPGDTVFVPDKASGGSNLVKNLTTSMSLLSGAAVAVAAIHTF